MVFLGRRLVQHVHERVFANNCSKRATNGCSPSRGGVELMSCERMFDSPCRTRVRCRPMTEQLTARQRSILDYIESSLRERGYPPSVREIGEAVGLTSPSTVHSHLATLQRMGFLRRDPTKPRAMEVRFDSMSGGSIERRPARHVPLVGEVAAGTDVLANENIEDAYPVPEDFTGPGDLFMLRVRGDSMIDAGILDGDYVVAHKQATAKNGEIVIAGIPGDEATVKTWTRDGKTVTLLPANERLAPMPF